MQDVNK